MEKLISGKDNLVRGASLKICHKGKVSNLQRPLQRLIPLEVQKETVQKDAKIDDANVPDRDDRHVLQKSLDLGNETKVDINGQMS